MKIKIRAIIQFLITSTIAILLYFVLGHFIPATIVGTISIVVLVSGLFFPTFFGLIEKFGQFIGKGVATGITWLMLVPLFYFIFFPVRIILCLLKKDPLNRNFPSTEKTCWTQKKATSCSEENYRKLY